MPAPVHLQPGQVAVRPVPDGDVFDTDDILVLTPVEGHPLWLNIQWNGVQIDTLVETLAGYCSQDHPGWQPLGSALHVAAVELCRRWDERRRRVTVFYDEHGNWDGAGCWLFEVGVDPTEGPYSTGLTLPSADPAKVCVAVKRTIERLREPARFESPDRYRIEVEQRPDSESVGS